MPSLVVFLGPSLPHAEAATILDARYLPPIKRGDIDALLERERPDALGIVDGQFFQSFSISPKEVLRAMNKGVQVFGSSSMGALRATELAPYGMIGVGQIFEMFAGGELDADDEVAMVYDSKSLEPLSDPMVNIRIALRAAESAGVLSASARAGLTDALKALFYPERSFRRLLEIARAELPGDEHRSLERFIAGSAPDAKRDDARALLRRMAEGRIHSMNCAKGGT